MAREVKACDECSRNCLLIHRGKHDLSPMVPPFFKVMFGKDFSEYVFVPPKFSEIIGSSVGKKAYLKDLTGQKWVVVLSDVRGSLAFQKGWHKFSLDHGLELGDFLLFRYITGSHFIVEIYGKSGYEKTFPSVKSYQNKIPKTTRNYITRKSPSDSFYEEREPSQGNDCCNAYTVPRSDIDTSDIIWSHDDVNDVHKLLVVAENVQSQENVVERPQLVPEVDLLVEPCFLTDRETSFAREDDRERLFDLSAFELPDMKPSFARKGDVDHPFDLSTSKMIGAFHEAHTGDTLFDTKKAPLIQGNVVPSKNHEAKLSSSICRPVPSDSPSLSMPCRSISPPKNICESHTCEPSAASGFSQPTGGTMRVVKPEQREFEQDFFGNVLADTPFGFNLSFKREAKNNFGDLGVSFNPTEDDVEACRIVKSEPVDFCDSPPALSVSAPAFRMTFLVPPDNDSYLELPEPLPMTWRQRNAVKPKVIALKDPAGRDWPVLYHKRSNLTVLTSGWKEFRKENNIRPGDECAFVAENLNNGEFQVQILSR